MTEEELRNLKPGDYVFRPDEIITNYLKMIFKINRVNLKSYSTYDIILPDNHPVYPGFSIDSLSFNRKYRDDYNNKLCKMDKTIGFQLESALRAYHKDLNDIYNTYRGYNKEISRDDIFAHELFIEERFGSKTSFYCETDSSREGNEEFYEFAISNNDQKIGTFILHRSRKDFEWLRKVNQDYAENTRYYINDSDVFSLIIAKAKEHAKLLTPILDNLLTIAKTYDKSK